MLMDSLMTLDFPLVLVEEPLMPSLSARPLGRMPLTGRSPEPRLLDARAAPAILEGELVLA
jgi:hypothetical protein